MLMPSIPTKKSDVSQHPIFKNKLLKTNLLKQIKKISFLEQNKMAIKLFILTFL